MNSGKNIKFILTRPNTGLCDINKLREVIINKYPLLNFEFVLLDCDKYKYYDIFILMKFDKNDDEIERLCI